MNKSLLLAGALCAILTMSCNNSSNAKTHQHDDGATHTDHAPDTAKPQQQEFVIGDSTKSDTVTKELHTHKDGESLNH